MLEQISENKFLFQTFGVGEFAFQLQKYILEGYRLDDSNEGYPVQYVGNFSCHLIKESDEVVTKVTRKKKSETE